ncbi:MAG TPA: dihydrodipicolinate synthase family protein [Acetobacteraceae bacterium]|nr:dihydrodipicolinate synthase family protein [Acetobacteraceae bacterium]
MSDPIAGLWAAATTPVDAAGAVDHAALARHAQRLLRWGCDGLVLFGSCGEGPSFSVAERLAATEAVLRAGVVTTCLALGTGCPAIADTVALTKGMLALGITRTLVLPPYYFAGVSPEGIEDAYAAVVDGVADARLSACLYHIPQVCGVPVPAPVLARLRARYGAMVSGVKDSSGDFASFLAFRAAAPDVATLVGAEVLIARAMAAGGQGTICGMANLVPALVRRLLVDAGAQAEIERACAPVDSIPMLKAVLAAITGEAIWRNVRPPLRAADAVAGARIATMLDTLEQRPAA